MNDWIVENCISQLLAATQVDGTQVSTCLEKVPSWFFIDVNLNKF